MDQNHIYINAYRKVLVTGLGLNVVYAAVAIAFGLTVGSSALLADAGHTVLSLVFAWFTVATTQQQSSQRLGYGLKHSEVLVPIFSVLLLFIAAGFIGWGAWQKFLDPVEIDGTEIMIIASAGVVINAATSLPFIKDPEEDQGVKEAFLPVAGSAAVSLGVVIAGLLIDWTGHTWIDPAIGFAILFVIGYQSWKLLINLINNGQDGEPEDINFQEVQYVLESLDGVQQVYNLRIWTLSNNEYALSAHLVLRENYPAELPGVIKLELESRFNITQTSIQIATDGNSSTKKIINGLT